MYPSNSSYPVDPGTRKLAHPWTYAAGLDRLVSRGKHGDSVTSFQVFFYFIRLLHNTCYKLLTTLNEWVAAHAICSDGCHTPEACLSPAIDIICRPLTFVIRANTFWTSLYNQWKSSKTYYEDILVSFALHNIKFFCRNHRIFSII